MLTPAMLPSMPQLPPPAIWRRAAWATMVTTLVGALALFVFIDVLVGNPDSLVWPLLHWTLVPVVLGCTLTWLAFRGLKPEDIGRRE